MPLLADFVHGYRVVYTVVPARRGEPGCSGKGKGSDVHYNSNAGAVRFRFKRGSSFNRPVLLFIGVTRAPARRHRFKQTQSLLLTSRKSTPIRRDRRTQVNRRGTRPSQPILLKRSVDKVLTWRFRYPACPIVPGFLQSCKALWK